MNKGELEASVLDPLSLETRLSLSTLVESDHPCDRRLSWAGTHSCIHVIPGIAVQANLQLRDVSLEMVEDFKHDRYKDDARVRNAEVNSSMGVSGTAGSLGMAVSR